VKRILFSLLTFAVIAIAWTWLVGAIGLWLTARRPQELGETDTYFIAGSWLFRLLVIIPLVLFSVWYWRRLARRAELSRLH
jgi:hypothetical protein